MSNSIKLPFTFAMNMNTQDETTGEELKEQFDKPFCIAMMGNFSNRKDVSENSNISDRRFIEVDRYNYDEVFASMGLQLSLSLDKVSDNSVDLAFNSLKDFHPDQLYKNVEVFSKLRDLRNRLKNPETFKQALQELGLESQQKEIAAQQGPETAEKPQSSTIEEPSQPESGGSLLDSIMDVTEGRSNQSAETLQSAFPSEQREKSLIDGFIKQLTANNQKTVSRDPRQNELVASIDEEITLQMRNLLHNPHFQALEATWRAVHFMVKRIRSDKTMKLYLLDVSQHELAIDLDVDDVTLSGVYKQFCDTSAGDIDWSLIIGDYRFGADIEDILLLSQMGIIANQAGTQFIAAADEKMVGCVSFAETPKADDWQYEISQPVTEGWALLRKSPVAKNICLALPRFILRAPYGSKSTKVNSFAFEEMSDSPEHEDYLWGNAAFFKAEQIARAFVKSGWKMQYASVMKTEDLPIHYYQEDGQTLLYPCAEIYLTDTGASKMLEQGLIPLWSVKNSDKVHSGDFHSIQE